ncbi:MAG: orotate phosphoribosyltransferase [Clostridiales bacterium]|jgi:orotate phosphoribosyltransferase|nr:orotate phosphoribosyltransferase [Clostridiales bacterium]
MNKEQIVKIFEESGALTVGHFLLTSGRHSSKYIQCAKVFQYPKYAQQLTKELSLAFEDDKVDIVIGPAVGGIILAYEMARCLNAKSIFSERENGIMQLRRGFSIHKNSKVLVVEDVVTTGGSVKEVIDLVNSLEGEVVGVGALVDRSNGNIDFGVRFHSLLTLDIKSYDPDSCPLCEKNIPIIKPGSRKINGV